MRAVLPQAAKMVDGVVLGVRDIQTHPKCR